MAGRSYSLEKGHRLESSAYEKSALATAPQPCPICRSRFKPAEAAVDFRRQHPGSLPARALVDRHCARRLHARHAGRHRWLQASGRCGYRLDRRALHDLPDGGHDRLWRRGGYLAPAGSGNLHHGDRLFGHRRDDLLLFKCDGHRSGQRFRQIDAETAHGQNDEKGAWALHSLWLRPGRPQRRPGTRGHQSPLHRHR